MRKNGQKKIEENDHEALFLKALLNELPQFVARSLQLHITPPKDKRLCKAIDYLHEHYTSDLSMEELSEIASLSLRILERILKKKPGSPSANTSKCCVLLKVWNC